MKIITRVICLFTLIYSSFSYGQMESYGYKRELSGIKEQWHEIVLPSTIFSNVSDDLSDIRIFGVKEKTDTIEVPYLLNFEKEEIKIDDIEFNIINFSINQNSSFFTIEVTDNKTINNINLNFNLNNFDWKVRLEGSQNQLEWFTILDDYRILSIDTKNTKFQFAKLNFPDCRYHYFRIHIDTEHRPKLISARVSKNTVNKGVFQSYSFSRKISNDKDLKQTVIDLNLKLPVPVSHIKIGIKDAIDYYRPVSIRYLVDSIKTEKGWKYNYNTLVSGMLNSMDKNEFKSKKIISHKLQIVINNGDNQPLSIDSIEVKAYIHKLIGRFIEPASYYLVYGKDHGNKPNYDLAHFKDKIPDSLISLNLGEEQSIEQKEPTIKEPLFKNKNLLWVLILLIIACLGWFSLKMMKKT